MRRLSTILSQSYHLLSGLSLSHWLWVSGPPALAAVVAMVSGEPPAFIFVAALAAFGVMVILITLWKLLRVTDSAPSSPTHKAEPEAPGTSKEPTRDVILTQGLMFVATGEWGHERCDWDDGLELRLNPLRKQFEQLAADGKLAVWGKPPGLENGVFVRIDAEFWRDFQVEWLSLLLGIPHTEARTGFPHRYHPFTHLMISKAQFERVDWQRG